MGVDQNDGDMAANSQLPTVIVRGIFRSGTNLAKHLILQAGIGRVMFNSGWHKHLPLLEGPTGAPEHPWLTCSKHPLAALESLYRYARLVNFKHFECHHQWPMFLSSPFTVRIHDFPNLPSRRYPSPIHYWNDFYRQELAHQPPLGLWRYEDILEDPQPLVDAAASFLGVQGQPVRLPAGVLDRTGDDAQQVGERREVFSRKDWHLQSRFASVYGLADLERLTSWFDQELMERMGYHSDGTFR